MKQQVVDLRKLTPVVTPDNYELIVVKKEYNDLVRELTPDERSALKESIIVHGQRESIVLNSKGVLIAGRNRNEILQELGEDIKTSIEDFPTEFEEKQYVIESNLMGRHYENTFQRIVAAIPLWRLIKSQQQIGGNKKNCVKIGTSTAIVGRKIGVHRNLVAEGIWLYENAPQHIISSLNQGLIKITPTYKQLKFVNFEKKKKEPKIKITPVKKLAKRKISKYQITPNTTQERILNVLLENNMVLTSELNKIVKGGDSTKLTSNLNILRKKGYKINTISVIKIEQTKGLCHKCYTSNTQLTLIKGIPICDVCRSKKK